MALRQLWKSLSGAAILVTAVVFGVSTPAAAGDSDACAGDVVVALDVRVKDRPGHDTWPISLPEPLAPGEWTVEARSFNGYEGRGEVTQPAEQWVLEIVDHVTLGPTTDLADEVTEASAVDQLGSFTTDTGVADLVVRHRSPDPESGPNSVVAVCVGFTAVAQPPPTTVPPTTVPPTAPPPTVPPPTVPPPTVPPPTVPPPTVPPTVPPPTVPPPTVPPSVPPTVPPPALPVARIQASASIDCATDTVLVILGNQGTAGATVDVALPRADLRSGLRVGAGALTTTTLRLADLEDTDTEIRVSDAGSGEIYARTPVSVDCTPPAAPSATVVLDCPSDAVVVHLANLEGAAAQLTVVHERVAVVAEVELLAGETREVVVPLADEAVIPIRVVDGDGGDVVRVEVGNECDPPDAPPGDGSGGDAPPDGSDRPPVAVSTDCSAVMLTGAAPFGVGVEVDGAVLVEGEAVGDVAVPLVPGVPTRIVVRDDGAPSQVVIPATDGCAEVRVVVQPDCAAASAAITVERVGAGRERFVVLVDSRVAGVMAIDGTGEGSVPIRLGDDGAEIAIARSFASAPIDLVVPCPTRDGPAGAVAASLVVVAVLATAAGVFQWPVQPRAK